MLIKFYIVCISITWFITNHRDMKKVQVWLFHLAYEGNKDLNFPHIINYTIKNYTLHIIYDLITCAWCVGSWIGMLGTIAFVSPFNIWTIMGNGFIVAILSVIVCKTIASGGRD